MIMRLPAQLSKRDPDTHKGDFGHVLVLAGSRRFTGAARLCARAAMRAGAGLVTLGIPESLHKIVAAKLTEVMVLSLPETKEASLSIRALESVTSFLKNVNTLLIGPGLSQCPETSLLVRQVIARADVSMVIDADALNALAGHLNILKKLKREVVLTPHPGEMARLAGRSVRDIQRDRIKIAKDFAVRYNMNLVLKGHRTVVASRGQKVYINRTGNPGMATGGSGDVLAGIIAAFLAQGLSGFQAAKFGVYVHGLSGDLAAKDKTQMSLIASDIIEYLPQAFKRMKSARRNAQS